MADYYPIAARLLDAGHRVLVTPEMGRHRKPSLTSHRAIELVIKQVSHQEGHWTKIWFTSGDQYLLPPDYLVKVVS